MTKIVKHVTNIAGAAAIAMALACPTLAVADDDGPIIAVSGPLSWPFFAAVKQGFDDASETFGLDYQYVAPK